jgi:hypothetical protein
MKIDMLRTDSKKSMSKEKIVVRSDRHVFLGREYKYIDIPLYVGCLI